MYVLGVSLPTLIFELFEWELSALGFFLLLCNGSGSRNTGQGVSLR
jgi:hypothetical protein